MLGRRKFLGTLSAGMAATMVPAGVVSAAGITRLRKQFAELVDREVQLRDTAGTIRTARLVELDVSATDPDLEQFSIVFEGEGLGEGLHEVYHPSIGTVRVGLQESTDKQTGIARQRTYFSKFA